MSLTIIHAVIFLPPNHPLDGVYAQQCLDHLAARGYRLLTIAREWPLVWSLLAAGRAQIVIFARREHWHANWQPRFEFVDDPSTHSRPRNDPPRGPRSRRAKITRW